MLKDVYSVIVEIGVLLTREIADPDPGIDPPSIQQRVSNLGSDDQLLDAGERYVTLIE